MKAWLFQRGCSPRPHVRAWPETECPLPFLSHQPFLCSYGSLTLRICSQEAVSLPVHCCMERGRSRVCLWGPCWPAVDGTVLLERASLCCTGGTCCAAVSVKLFFQFNPEESLRQQRDAGMPVDQCVHKSKFLFRRDSICFWVF